jgi:hypothetical protein
MGFQSAEGTSAQFGEKLWKGKAMPSEQGFTGRQCLGQRVGSRRRTASCWPQNFCLVTLALCFQTVIHVHTGRDEERCLLPPPQRLRESPQQAWGQSPTSPRRCHGYLSRSSGDQDDSSNGQWQPREYRRRPPAPEALAGESRPPLQPFSPLGSHLGSGCGR